MSDEPTDLHDLAGGWIQERKNTPVPAFLKLAYVGFGLFGLAYLLLYWAGATGHATRGSLVQQFNAIAPAPSTAVLGGLFLVVLAYVAGLLYYAFFAKEEA